MNSPSMCPEPRQVPGTFIPRVLIIAPHGSYRTAAFIEAARSQQCEVMIASAGQHSIVSEYAKGLQIDFSNPDAAVTTILSEAAQRPFASVIGTDDSSMEIATQVAEQLNLPHNPINAIKLAGRKDQARQCLAHSGVNTPDFRILKLDEPMASQLTNVVFPSVLKPVSLSASRGVIRVNDRQELEQAIERIDALLSNEGLQETESRNRLLLEQFIPGEEVAVEAMLYQGELEILTIFDKPDPMNGPFFEETYYLTPSRHSAEIQQEIFQQVSQACRAYGLVEGPVHAECRINEQGVWILEIAARTIGGLCGRLLTFGTGYSLEELVLSHARGQRLNVQCQSEAAGVLMIPIPKAGILKRVEGLLAAQGVPLIEEVNIQIREGYELLPLPEGGSYLGFIFARGDKSEAVEQALREAHACLNIVIAPLWKVKV